MSYAIAVVVCAFTFIVLPIGALVASAIGGGFGTLLGGIPLLALYTAPVAIALTRWRFWSADREDHLPAL
jgi:hypothetical protein